MERVQKNLSALVIFIICAVLLSAFGVQLLMHETPCPLCLLQRLCMIAVAISLLLNNWFGVRPAHYGLGLLGCLLGGSIALRQIALHVCPGFPTFGIPVLGLSLYTWSFLVFACSVLAIALLLLFYQPKNPQSEVVSQLSILDRVAFTALVLVVILNIITTFLQCGIGGC